MGTLDLKVKLAILVTLVPQEKMVFPVPRANNQVQSVHKDQLGLQDTTVRLERTVHPVP